MASGVATSCRRSFGSAHIAATPEEARRPTRCRATARPEVPQRPREARAGRAACARPASSNGKSTPTTSAGVHRASAPTAGGSAVAILTPTRCPRRRPGSRMSPTRSRARSRPRAAICRATTLRQSTTREQIVIAADVNVDSSDAGHLKPMITAACDASYERPASPSNPTSSSPTPAIGKRRTSSTSSTNGIQMLVPPDAGAAPAPARTRPRPLRLHAPRPGDRRRRARSTANAKR